MKKDISESKDKLKSDLSGLNNAFTKWRYRNKTFFIRQKTQEKS